ncbi:GDSL-type esterase/lipase family protein [Stygiobacter electus]|uniref:GDSL-type esterase/lipase family protein n=1 Tax=Stygiobacter electus TaxID=3032292 RepID=A0AAE3P2U5_9BACT|nr:GDSL-type esterase/lipase family protein [Stygiobacter electus]MDF1613059.1 GDSL-type esterase/lipase family protein [Stygiobacter electus]
MKIILPVNFIVALIILTNLSVFGQLKPIRVACVGNSITWGGLGDKSYPEQLGKLLGSHYVVKNFGISARALLRKSDYPYWNEQTFSEAKEFEPQIVIIKLGTNDTKPQNWVYGKEFFSNYVDFINEFRKGPVKPQIFISYPCPVFKTVWGIRDSIVKIIIPIIDSVRNTAKTDLIDFNTPFLDSASLFPDGVHPNAAGYLKMAQIAKDAILNSAPGIIRTFNSNKYFFDKGESCKLYWETTKGSEVTLNGVSVNEIDSTIVTLTETKSFILIAKGKDRSDTMRIKLNYFPAGSIKSFNAKPRMLELGANDTSKIYWAASLGSQVFLNNIPVEITCSLAVSPRFTTSYKLSSIGDTSTSKEISIKVLPAEEINRSLDREVHSSSYAKYFPADNAVDGNPFTYWKSKNEATPWIYVDFGKEFTFERVVLDWGNNYAISYQLQAVSSTGVITTIYNKTNGSGGRENILLNGTGRYLRMLCSQKLFADSGYVLNEFEIYGRKKVTEVVDETNSVQQFELFQNYPNPFSTSASSAFGGNPRSTIKYFIPNVILRQAQDDNVMVSQPVGRHGSSNHGVTLRQAQSDNIATLKVYDILGREVAVLVNEYRPAGNYEVEFDASTLASGIYLYSLQMNGLVKNKKMIVLK